MTAFLGQVHPLHTYCNANLPTILYSSCVGWGGGEEISGVLYMYTICFTATISLLSQNLTWRDIQYLFAYTSNPTSLVNGEWTTNGAGLSVSQKFGFGAIDAEAMVTRARRWIIVPEQITETYQGSASSG